MRTLRGILKNLWFVKNPEILMGLRPTSVKQATSTLSSNLHHSIVNHFNPSTSSFVKFQPRLSDRYIRPCDFLNKSNDHCTPMLGRTGTQDVKNCFCPTEGVVVLVDRSVRYLRGSRITRIQHYLVLIKVSTLCSIKMESHAVEHIESKNDVNLVSIKLTR